MFRRFIKALVAFPRWQMFILIVLSLIALSTGVAYLNWMVIPGVILCMVIAFVLLIGFEPQLDALGLTDLQQVVLCLLPGIALLCLSACLFPPGSAEREKENMWLVNGDAHAENAFVVARPFWDRITFVLVKQDITMHAVAQTKDGKRVRGYLHANLRLVSEPSIVTRALGNKVNPNNVVKQALAKEVREAFEHAVAKRNLDELSNTLVLEWDTGSAVDRNLLASVGVEWAGTMHVNNIHAYFAQN